MGIQHAIGVVSKHQNLTQEEAEAAMDEIMSGNATPAQIGGYLMALRLKGETVDEITGSARSMRRAANHPPVKSQGIIDTCGTGGDGSGTGTRPGNARRRAPDADADLRPVAA